VWHAIDKNIWKTTKKLRMMKDTVRVKGEKDTGPGLLVSQVRQATI
jgi:hypothetical protein